MPVGKNKKLSLQKPEAKSSDHTSKSLNNNWLNVSIRKKTSLAFRQSGSGLVCFHCRPLTDDSLDSIATNAPAELHPLLVTGGNVALKSRFTMTIEVHSECSHAAQGVRKCYGHIEKQLRKRRQTEGKRELQEPE